MRYTFRGVELPDHIKESLDAYSNDGRPTGGFLECVIDNDLKGAYARADEISIASLPAIVGYLYNEVDARCWGKPGSFKEWTERKKIEREQRRCEEVSRA